MSNNTYIVEKKENKKIFIKYLKKKIIREKRAVTGNGRQAMKKIKYKK